MKRIIVLLVSVLSAFISGCGSSSNSTNNGSYDTSTGSVVASAIAGAAASSDDSSGSPVSMREKVSPPHKLDVFSLLLPKANALSCLTHATITGLTCTGAVMTLPLAGCTVDASAWTGSYTLTYNSAGACGNAKAGGLLGMGTGGDAIFTSPSPGVTRTVLSGEYVTSSSDASGWNAMVNGGLKVTCNSADCSTTTGRTVNILGVHRQAFTAGSNLIFDHSFNTPTAFTITGTGASRAISAGTIVLQHNLAHFVATSTVTEPVTFSAGCCFPTGGEMTTTFSAGRTGTETLAFGPTCGNATVNGNAIALSHCQ